MFLCSGCGRFSAGGATHSHCADRTPLTGLIALYHYANPTVRGLIKEYKYHNAQEIEEPLEKLLLAGLLPLKRLVPEGVTVVSVPLHISRERDRGFNQASRLGRFVAKGLGLEYSAPLKRTRKTFEQAKLSVPERAENCLQAFVSQPVSGDFLLIDDVVTTGATFKAAAIALKAAGADRIYALAFAHG